MFYRVCMSCCAYRVCVNFFFISSMCVLLLHIEYVCTIMHIEYVCQLSLSSMPVFFCLSSMYACIWLSSMYAQCLPSMDFCWLSSMVRNYMLIEFGYFLMLIEYVFILCIPSMVCPKVLIIEYIDSKHCMSSMDYNFQIVEYLLDF